VGEVVGGGGESIQLADKENGGSIKITRGHPGPAKSVKRRNGKVNMGEKGGLLRDVYTNGAIKRVEKERRGSDLLKEFFRQRNSRGFWVQKNDLKKPVKKS